MRNFDSLARFSALIAFVIVSCDRPQQQQVSEEHLVPELERAYALADEGALLLLQDSERATAMLERAFKLLKTHQAPAVDRHGCASNLVDAYLSVEQFEAADRLLREILSAPKADSFVRARAQCQLGLLKLATGELNDASTAFEQALSRADRIREEGHPAWAGLALLVRVSYSRYWHEVKNYRSADRLLQEAYDLASESDRRAIVSDLLLTALRSGDTEAAERWDAEFRALLEKLDLSLIDRVLANHVLAEQLISSKDEASAEALLQSSLERVSEEVADPLLAPVYNNLGLVRLRLGRSAEALGPLDSALRHLGTKVGNYRQLHMEILENRAFCQTDLGNQSSAYEDAKAAFGLGHQLVEAVLQSGTEAQRRSFQADRNLIGFLAQLAERNALMRPLLANALFTWKGLIIESILRDRADAGDYHDLGVNWRMVQDSIPNKGVLVDYVRYREPSGTEALGAIILASKGEPAWVPLVQGKALQSLEARIEGLPTDSPVEFERRMDGIHRDLWEPVISHFPSTCESVFICPDSFLRDLPFAYLREAASGKVLCEIYKSGAMLMAARDLLNPNVPTPSKGTWAVYAAEQFGLARTATPSPVRKALSTFGDLKHARDEWLAIKAIGTNSGFRVERLGSLGEVKASPRVLHVITHGFTVRAPLDRVVSDSYCLIQEGLEESVRAIEKGKPLDHDRDHFFTPAEAAELRLDDTYLVVLSTCRSAEGIDVGGERISGFGRAFTLAGAKNVLLTMWRIRDREAREFMESFTNN